MRYLGAMTVVETPKELTRAADWLLRATPRQGEVCSLLPDVFDAYARIFHPAMREAEERDLPLRAPGESRRGVPVYNRDYGVPWLEVTWHEVAEANGRMAHPAMQWPAITDGRKDQPGLWERAPQIDSLPLRHTAELCDVLAACTTTPARCWAAVWEGYSGMVGLREDLQLPRLTWSRRSMILASGL